MVTKQLQNTNRVKKRKRSLNISGLLFYVALSKRRFLERNDITIPRSV